MGVTLTKIVEKMELRNLLAMDWKEFDVYGAVKC